MGACMGVPGKWTVENLQRLAIFLTEENRAFRRKGASSIATCWIQWRLYCGEYHHHTITKVVFSTIIYDFVIVRQLKPLQEECKHQ